jgi:hypothetical protein
MTFSLDNYPDRITGHRHENANLLTGNGPQAMDDQAARLREILEGARARTARSVAQAPITAPAA